jgi:hypothetical protein
MLEGLIETIDSKKDSNGFIKVTDEPLSGLTATQKVLLNRKGNILFNKGDIEGARRIFITTGYSDGLTRIGDKYLELNKSLQALKMFILAHNTKKSEPLFEKIAGIVSMILKE